MRALFVLLALTQAGLASAETVWLSRATIAERVANHAPIEIPPTATHLVLPIELQLTDRAKLTVEDLTVYSRETVPSVIQACGARKLPLSLVITFPVVGENLAAGYSDDEFERGFATTFKPKPFYRYLNEKGLRHRATQVRTLLQQYAKSGAFRTVVDLRYPGYPLLLHSTATREWAVTETAFDPVDLPELEGYSPTRMPTVPEATQTAIQSLSQRLRGRYIRVIGELWTEFTLPRATFIGNIGLAAMTPYQLVHRRIDTPDLAKLPMAEGLCLYATTPEEVAALRQDYTARLIQGLPSGVELNIAVTRAAMPTAGLPTLTLPKGRTLNWIVVE